MLLSLDCSTTGEAKERSVVRLYICLDEKHLARQTSSVVLRCEVSAGPASDGRPRQMDKRSWPTSTCSGRVARTVAQQNDCIYLSHFSLAGRMPRRGRASFPLSLTVRLSPPRKYACNCARPHSRPWPLFCPHPYHHLSPHLWLLLLN